MKFLKNVSTLSIPIHILTQRLLVMTTCVLIGIAIGWVLSENQSSGIVHINPNQVFVEFKMTQELKAKMDNVQQARSTLLRNLDLRIRELSASSNPPQDSLKALQLEHTYKAEQFAADHEQQLQQFNKQIWTQLNQYIQDYCQDKGYTYILGASGDGNLMGANPQQDITEAVIQFVNQQYEGA